ncbi:50S ribosomal protein bL37 [Fuerstiella marisgermanici]
MAKTNRKLTKANHGRRPASSKARKLKRRHVKLSR